MWVPEKSEIKREMIQLTVERQRNVSYPHFVLPGCTVRIRTLPLRFHQTYQPVVYVHPPLDSTMRYS